MWVLVGESWSHQNNRQEGMTGRAGKTALADRLCNDPDLGGSVGELLTLFTVKQDNLDKPKC